MMWWVGVDRVLIMVDEYILLVVVVVVVVGMGIWFGGFVFK